MDSAMVAVIGSRDDCGQPGANTVEDDATAKALDLASTVQLLLELPELVKQTLLADLQAAIGPMTGSLKTWRRSPAAWRDCWQPFRGWLISCAAATCVISIQRWANVVLEGLLLRAAISLSEVRVAFARR
jgi:hypothetical protein